MSWFIFIKCFSVCLHSPKTKLYYHTNLVNASIKTVATASAPDLGCSISYPANNQALAYRVNPTKWMMPFWAILYCQILILNHKLKRILFLVFHFHNQFWYVNGYCWHHCLDTFSNRRVFPVAYSISCCGALHNFTVLFCFWVLRYMKRYK